MIVSSCHRIKIRPLTYWVLFIILYCPVFLGCGRQNEKGILEVRVKDHREAIGDFSTATITVESVRVSPKVGFRFWHLGWIELNPSVDRVDLTQFVDHFAATIFKDQIDAGSFEALDLKLRDVQAILKQNSTKVPIANKVTPVALTFSVNPGGVTMIVLDLAVMDMSDHPSQAYELQLRGYEIYNNDKLIDKVPPA
jgi:hypothetical protein